MSSLRTALVLILAGTSSAALAEQITCESRQDRTEACGTVAPGSSVRLVEQISTSPCVEGRTWGTGPDRDSIWVSGGCRAVFDVQPPYSAANERREEREQYQGSRYANADHRREHARHACIEQAAGGRFSRNEVTASDAQWIGEGMFSVNLDTPDGPLNCTVDRDGNVRSIDNR